MKNYLPVMTAFMTIIAVVVGAGIQYLSSRSLEFEKKSLEFRFEAYRDFLEGQIMSSRGEATGDEEMHEKGKKLIRESTLRIAVFSPKNVAVVVAEWLYERRKNKPFTVPTEEYLKDLALYHAMRKEAFRGKNEQMISDQEMAVLVHGNLLKKKNNTTRSQRP